jgi:hypothetical protein
VTVEQAEHLSRFERFEEWYFSKSKVWLWTGLAVVFVGLLLGAVRDSNEFTLVNLLITGISTGTVYQQAVTTDTLIQHSTEQVLLLAMSLLKLGIGGYIYTIVRRLEFTGNNALVKLSLGKGKPKKPFFRNLFPRLLVFGTDVQLINVGVIMVIWDLNALNLLHLQFIGQTSGPAFAQALTVEQLIGTLVVPVEMLGATFMLTGIPLGLASITWNLRFQLRMLPELLHTYITERLEVPFPNVASAETQAHSGPVVSRSTLAITLIGLSIGISGLLVGAPIRTANLLGLLSLQLSGQTTSVSYLSLALFERIAGMTTEQWLFVGLGLAILSINLWLLHIIKALERTRKAFSDILAATTGVRIYSAEERFWPVRLVLPFALTGFAFMVINFFLGLAADSAFVTQYQAQITGATNTAGFQQSVLSGTIYAILSRNIKFISFGLLLTGVGFALVTIIVNLKLTASTLLNVFSRLTTHCSSGGKKPEEPEEVQLPSLISVAPWRLFALIALGGVIAISAFFPLGILDALSYVRYQTLAFAPQSSTPAYFSALLTEHLWEHSLLPWKLLGMGTMLFGAGRTFGVIVGFVKARTVTIGEFVDSIKTIAEQRPRTQLLTTISEEK